MATIERTAYPRFKKNISAKELVEIYTPSHKDIEVAHKVTKGEIQVLNFILLLKSFQRLGYFPKISEIPIKIVKHLCLQLNITSDIELTITNRTLYRYKSSIRKYLNVTEFGASARHVITEALIEALNFLLANEDRRVELLPATLDLGFASVQWQNTVIIKESGNTFLARRHLEVCIFYYLAAGLKTGDLCIDTSEEFADYREQLLPWNECEPLISDFCAEMNFKENSNEFVEQLKSLLKEKSIEVDKNYPNKRKLNNYSHKNKLYQTFRELGRVIRTIFLLKYISDIELRQQITSSTNKIESYNGFSKFFLFGGEGVISENDPDEQEKRIKYNDLVSNAVILQNVVDMTYILKEFYDNGVEFTKSDVAALSPYLTRHIKRFGDYVINLKNIPNAIDRTVSIPMKHEKVT